MKNIFSIVLMAFFLMNGSHFIVLLSAPEDVAVHGNSHHLIGTTKLNQR